MPSEYLRTAVVNTHPIQYFAPLYSEIERLAPGFMRVIFASRRGVDRTLDEEFGVSFPWDLDLLSGYDHEFLPEAAENASRPSETVRCASLAARLAAFSPEVVVSHGYADPCARQAIAWCRHAAIPLVLRGDTWAGPGERRGAFRRLTKRIWFRARIRPLLRCCMAVGSRNAAYWHELGVPASAVCLVPYGVDVSRFRPAAPADRRDLRRAWSLPAEDPIIGFVGKLSHRKGILQLLEFLTRAESQIDAHLVLVGDGTLRTAVLAAAVRAFRAHTFLGFQNQLRMPELYQLMDLLIVPSKEMETWGFVVQEALACETPVFASDAVGAAPDLIRQASHGLILPYGDWPAWRAQLIAWRNCISSMQAHQARATWGRVPSQQTAASAFIECVRRTPSHA